jgi:hypothetical protein
MLHDTAMKLVRYIKQTAQNNNKKIKEQANKG